MPGWFAGDVVRFEIGHSLASVAVKPRRTQAGDDRNLPTQVAADQFRRKVFHPNPTATIKESDIGVRRKPQPGIVFDLSLPLQRFGQWPSVPAEPGRIENVQIAGVERRR